MDSEPLRYSFFLRLLADWLLSHALCVLQDSSLFGWTIHLDQLNNPHFNDLIWPFGQEKSSSATPSSFLSPKVKPEPIEEEVISRRGLTPSVGNDDIIDLI